MPRQNSTCGKHRLGGISKRGNPYLRRLLINGASANLLRSKATNADPWVIGLRQRRPSLVVAVALANKTARIAWAVMHRHENYQRVAAAGALDAPILSQGTDQARRGSHKRPDPPPRKRRAGTRHDVLLGAS